ncbi:MAG: sugar ABC transporter ATP-binding protein [Rhizobiaceae bacterium]|nr:sugar ABC transporter ATP-binding protein [Rhizobiaceae bacterium]
MSDIPALEVHGVSKKFGNAHALRDVSLTLRKGEVHSVIGENGAGKSTLMGIICGRLQPDTGTLQRDGKQVRFASPREAQSSGIAIAPQELNVLPMLSVAENIMIGAQPRGTFGISWSETRKLAEQFLHEIDEDIDTSTPMGELSAAHQQLVQIARATASHADVLIFDEPTAMLTDREAEKLFLFIARFKQRGGSVLYVSHRLNEILELSDSISVLRDGELVAQIDPAEATKEKMVNLMAGREVKSLHISGLRKQNNDQRETVLSVQNLTRKGEFEDISFDLRKGEILAISGLIGSGRTELGKCLFGLQPPDSGKVLINGREVVHSSPSDAIQNGLIYLPEERKKEGLFPLLSVAENICIASLDRFKGLFGLRQGAMVKRSAPYFSSMKLKAADPSIPISTLSGGNQQKAIIARWLMKECDILILDEPTRGIDVNAKFEIQALLTELTDKGLSIVFISSELQEVLDVSDRILVMHEGKMKGLVETNSVTQERLLQIAMT